MTFPVWATVSLGGGPSDPLEIRKALRGIRCKVGDEAAVMLEGIPSAPAHTEVDIVTPTVAELGSASGASWSTFVIAGLAQGLELCPPEAAWQACLQSRDKLGKNEHITFAMEPVTVTVAGHGQRPCVFALLRILESLYLGNDPAFADVGYGPKARIAFVQPRG